MISSLYLHIPFCQSICSYCDFPKVYHNKEWEEKYIPLLIEEIESYSIKDKSLKTIYIGGGTPSILSSALREKMLSYLNRRFPNVAEFTREANPESITEEKAAIRKKYGVNRVSLGVESTSTSLLKRLGRTHTNEQVRKAVSLLKQSGIFNLNFDFIYGIPGESLTDLNNDISFALSQGVKHLSFYSLQLEEGTRLFDKKTIPVTDDEYRKQYDHLVLQLSIHGYQRYEVSNFSLPGYESKHNLTYWHDEQYYACGVGASGYIKDLRYTNTKSITKYLSGERVFSKDTIRKEDEEREFLRLGLRLEQGFSLEEYRKRFGQDFLSVYSKKIEENNTFFDSSDGRFRIRKEYLYIRDSLLLSLF